MRLILLLITMVFLGGCATPQPILRELQYVAPTGQASSLATLAGFQEERALLPDLTAYVFAVDDKRVMSEREGWSTALPMQPGLHKITVFFQRGVYNAQVDLQLQAVAGDKYQIRFSPDFDFWIIDVATQKPVTEIVRGTIMSFPTRSIIEDYNRIR